MSCAWAREAGIAITATNAADNKYLGWADIDIAALLCMKSPQFHAPH
jgi:hypothetical protein